VRSEASRALCSLIRFGLSACAVEAVMDPPSRADFQAGDDVKDGPTSMPLGVLPGRVMTSTGRLCSVSWIGRSRITSRRCGAFLKPR
jgi:hypothetical protein